jgi:sortase A
MKAKRGTVWINAGLLLIAAALFLSVYNEWESHEARDSARQVIAQLCDALPTEAGEPTTLPDVRREMPVKTINGRDYIGVLSIPSLELELPVISQWDYPALKVAPCRYSGSLYQDNLIICAHNYASHFGKLKELQPGDIVLFTDMDEHVVTFQMVERETLNPMDAEGMEAGDWDLTLFTCTIDGQTRVTIRFERVEVFRNPETEEPAKSEK